MTISEIVEEKTLALSSVVTKEYEQEKGDEGKEKDEDKKEEDEKTLAMMLSKNNEPMKLEKFYANKSILITGVTGFIGKVFLLKLMHSLKSCKKVYVMLRPKKGVEPEERFKKLLSEEPFVPPPSTNPNGCPSWLLDKWNKKGISPEELLSIDWAKVQPIEGNMNDEDLGFSSEIKAKLCAEVNIVFNIAASVQFEAPLKENLADNYLGCKNLLELATKFENLISYVHVSTFYTNSHMKHIEEKVLTLEKDCQTMANSIVNIPTDALNKITNDIMENRPNTYIYTKAMAENLVMKYEGILPLAIVRPSIIINSLVHPYPGWLDNVNGPMGLGTLASLGILRNIDWNYDGVSDLIPVDYVVNSMFCVAERTARLYSKKILIYNCSSSSLNPITWGEFFEIVRAESMEAPPYKMLRVPIQVPRHNRANRVGLFVSRCSEILFAYLIDFLLFLFGHKPILRKITAKLHYAYKILQPFTTKDYTCSNENLVAAYDEMNPEDKETFCFQPNTIDWSVLLVNGYYGLRRILLKENPANIPVARRKKNIHMVVELLFTILFYLSMGMLVYNTFTYYFTTKNLSPSQTLHADSYQSIVGANLSNATECHLIKIENFA